MIGKMQQPPPTPCSPRQAAAAAKSPTASFSSPSSSSLTRVQQHMAQTSNKPITKPIKTATMGDAVRPKSLSISSSTNRKTTTSTTYSSAAAAAAVTHTSLPPGDIFRNIDDVVSYCDKFLDLPSMYSSHRCTSNSASSLPIAGAGACAQHHHHHNRNLIIATLCANLKIYGPQLEQVCKDVLDRVFVCLRQSSIMDDDEGDEKQSLDAVTRLLLLQVIELRAAGWTQPPNESTVMSYYSNKLSTLQLQAISDGNGRSTATTQRTWPDADLLANHQTITTSTPLSPTAAAAADDDDAGQQLPLLLEPGQVVKSTGKYGDACYIAASSSASSSSRIGQLQQASDVTTTTNNNSNNRLSGLSIYKDEVVIRNSDSGKVMGIKGKRVHLIEEISDTVISFQRVNPGAKERLVQITGAHLGNIRTAKQLIEQTIQRNQSPTPPPLSTSSLISPFVIAGAAAGAGVMDSNNVTKTAADEAVESTSSSRVTASRSDDGVEADVCTVLGDYQHTVTAMGGNSITISGNNLPLVEMAKLVLDEYFKGAVTNTNFNLPSSYDERNCNNNMTILSSSHRLETTNDPPAIISAAAAANANDNDLCSAVMAAVYEPCTITVGGSSSSSSIATVNGIGGGGGDGKHATTRNDDRRSCFRKSDAASSAGKEKEGEEEEEEEEPNKQLKKVGPAGGASCGDGVGEASAVVLVRCSSSSNDNSNNSSTIIKYDREVLIHFSQSPHSRVPPTNFHLVHLNAPDIVAAKKQ